MERNSNKIVSKLHFFYKFCKYFLRKHNSVLRFVHCDTALHCPKAVINLQFLGAVHHLFMNTHIVLV